MIVKDGPRRFFILIFMSYGQMNQPNGFSVGCSWAKKDENRRRPPLNALASVLRIACQNFRTHSEKLGRASSFFSVSTPPPV